MINDWSICASPVVCHPDWSLLRVVRLPVHPLGLKHNREPYTVQVYDLSTAVPCGVALPWRYPVPAAVQLYAPSLSL